MKTRHLALLLLALFTLGAAPSSTPVAMVTDVKGMPTLAGGPRAIPLTIQTMLRTGDRLKLGKGDQARLIFLAGPASGRQEALEGPCEVEVQPGGSKLISGQAGALKVERQPVRTPLVPGRNLDRMAGIGLRGILRITMLPAVREAPTFTWETTIPGPYAVMVVDPDDPTRHLWQGETTEKKLRYGGPDLQPDLTYVWTVTATDPNTGVTRATGSLRLVSDEAREHLEEAREAAEAMARENPDDPTPQVLMMTLYLDNYLLAEAADWGEKASLLRKDDLALHQVLTELYYAMGRYEEGRRHNREAARVQELLDKQRKERDPSP